MAGDNEPRSPATPTMPEFPTFSIVINTDGRARSLAKTLQSLRHVDYPRFEVCVVCGPTPDGTRELLDSWRGQIKIAECPVRNLAVSRNIGVALAAGEIVAFIDDDAMPEAEWLRDLAVAYDAPDVGGSGGFVHDESGVTFQWRFGTADRLGIADQDWKQPAPALNVPQTEDFPTLLGTNCSFRRTALLDIGGFDEEYEYFLEETDACCRLVDQGWKIVQLTGAYVHHRLLSGGVRTEQRVIRHWYPVFKNKIYFSLLNGRQHHDIDSIVRSARRFIRGFDWTLYWSISKGHLTGADRARFREEVARAWGDGLSRGLAGQRRLISDQTRRAFAAPFLRFASAVPAGGRKTFCFLTQNYPPGPMAGIARYMHQLARGVAALGHHVHVLTKGEGKDRIDFEDGVWVHRVAPRRASAQTLPGGPIVPKHIWNHAAAMLREVERVAARRPVHCVYSPLWDCEGLAVLIDARFPLVVGLQTPMRMYLSTKPEMDANPGFMAETGRPILLLEKYLLERAAGIHAISTAIASDIEKAYAVALSAPRLAIAPLGLEDWSVLPAVAAPDLPAGTLRLLFVGRLENRKGIDVLLKVMPRLLARHPQLHVDIVGNDTLLASDGRPYRAAFEADPATAGIRDRIVFHGEVSDDTLRGFYRACDVFVAPSRFESFGLILLEAMIFGKPVVACKAGGMVEVVADGETGLLADPGDSASLEKCLNSLIENAALRERMGLAGRQRYAAQFTPDRMAKDVAALFCRVGDAYGSTRPGAVQPAAAE
jgi:glycogen synthase